MAIKLDDIKAVFLRIVVNSTDTAQNTVISPNFLLWKFYGKAQFPL